MFLQAGHTRCSPSPLTINVFKYSKNYNSYRERRRFNLNPPGPFIAYIWLSLIPIIA